MSEPGIYRLEGVVQHYQWGGTEFLPHWLDRSNPKQEPWAEYWMGTHPKGPAQLLTTSGQVDLSAWLAEQPEALGPEVLNTFGELPFLYKILDVRQMLSIQLHPTREMAAAGFAAEEAAGIPRLAAHRNYKDRNHKPEVMVALTDFWLLHGFQTDKAIAKSLQSVPGWESLQSVFNVGGVSGLYEYVMHLPQPAVTALLQPLYDDLYRYSEQLHPDQPAYWAWQAFEQYTKDGQHDRGIFSVYWFNLVRLAPGEGIFQGAGIPHAYLRGVNVELMANSDNVLRGGLTPKHIDVPELLKNIRFDAITPQRIKGEKRSDEQIDYPVPAPDFALDKIELTPNASFHFVQQGPAILLALKGAVTMESVQEKDLRLSSGESCFITHGTEVHLKTLDHPVVLYRAFVKKER